MSFKGDVAADIQNVFLNEDEFAEKHIIDGKEMLASIDEVKLQRHNNNDQEWGNQKKKKKSIVLYVAGMDFGKLPAANRILVLDGRNYLVKDAVNDSGMFVLTLEVA